MLGAKLGQFGFELSDAALQGFELFVGDEVGDVLRAIAVPGFDGDDHGLLGAGAIAGGHQFFDHGGIVLHAGAAPDLDAPFVDIIHEEQADAVVLAQVARADVLAVTGVVGEAEGPGVEDAEKSFGAAAMLDVGLAVLAGGAEVEAVEPGEEMAETVVDFGVEAAFCFHPGVAFAGTVFFLDGFHGGGEGDVAAGR